MATQVATFMKGLRDGPVNKFREFPSTLEAAISLAQQNEFSCRQARAHSTRGAARHEAKPMDLSMVQQHAPFRRDAPPPMSRSGPDGRRAAPPQWRPAQRRKKRHGPVGAGRPTGRRWAQGNTVEPQRLGPHVLLARLTTASSSSAQQQLIVIALDVVGFPRCLRALLDTGATNNFVRSGCRKEGGMQITLHNGVQLAVRLADGSTLRAPKRSVLLKYGFDGFRSTDEFLELVMDDKFDVILGMPWLMRHQPKIDWLHRSVTPKAGVSVDEIVAHLVEDAPRWPHVTVVPVTHSCDHTSSACDGPARIAVQVARHLPSSQSFEGLLKMKNADAPKEARRAREEAPAPKEARAPEEESANERPQRACVTRPLHETSVQSTGVETNMESPSAPLLDVEKCKKRKERKKRKKHRAVDGRSECAAEEEEAREGDVAGSSSPLVQSPPPMVATKSQVCSPWYMAPTTSAVVARWF
ncbi:TPA: hypothetical protein N0F65_005746 [Lagenidium giganteum]|uniref:Uncharacterized protein n=1 Tax=Lagenidium giganteum TaxID=4803 RepID=A0AAV2YZJ8_9STRA|nr:TPA: hypothetical protein N0F65_005746 [Lagenidium giganteum]